MTTSDKLPAIDVAIDTKKVGDRPLDGL
jgi:hypothetical protein